MLLLVAFPYVIWRKHESLHNSARDARLPTIGATQKVTLKRVYLILQPESQFGKMSKVDAYDLTQR
jgi:hypothetical protein